MKKCCESEAKKNVRRHRDVAVCDGCGRLVLGYTNEPEFQKTQDELAKNGVAFEAAKVGTILVIAKDRSTSSAVDEDDEDDDDDEG